MLSIFYVLAGLVMILLVLLVPLRQLKEEERIEQVYDRLLPGTPEHLQNQLLKKLEKRKPNPRSWHPPHIQDYGLIKRYHYHTETERYVPIARDVHLTIGGGPKNVMSVVGIVTIVTMIGLPLWAAVPLYSSYDSLVQQPGTVKVLTVVSVLALLMLLFILYYYFIGRNIGPKIDIIFRRPSQATGSYWTRTMVQTSLGKRDDKLVTEIVEEINVIAENKTKVDRED